MKRFDTILMLAAALFATLGVSSAAPGAMLIGHWGFEEGAGGTALDSSANGLNGAITNATYTGGKVGDYALDFNGSNAYVEVLNSPLLVPSTIGISMWFKARETQQTSTDLLDKGHGAGSTPYHAGYVFQYSENTSEINTIYGTGSTFAYVGTGLGFKDDKWHHLAANLGQDAIEVYVDGDLVDSVPGQGPIIQNDSNLYFGRHRTLGRYFNGLLDEIRIYDGRLSQSDVDALVPEPTTIALLTLGGLAVLARRRKAGQ